MKANGIPIRAAAAGLILAAVFVFVSASGLKAELLSFLPKGEKDSSNKKTKILFDFEDPEIMKMRNVTFGTWELHPSYTAEINVVKPASKKEAEEKGSVLLLDYDVSIPDKDLPYAAYPVYNGVWFKLGDMNITGYDNIVLSIKGDPKKGFTSLCKIELKNNFKETGSHYIDGISAQWKKYKIPIKYLKTATGKPIQNLTSMQEITLVFEKNHVTAMKGVVYVDNIGFEGPKDLVEKAAAEKK